MGSCFSLKRSECESESQTLFSTAKVVSLKGDLVEYKVPVFVSQVLQDEASSPSPSPSSCFLCNSDGLLFDDYIPALDSDGELQANQIYFVLPTSKLQYKLSASDMAALAVKASIALQNGRKKGSNRRKRARISPVLPVSSSNDNNSNFSATASKVKMLEKPFIAGRPDNISMSRSGSVGRLHRYTSRRTKLAVRSFRLRLATIYEGIVM